MAQTTLAAWAVAPQDREARRAQRELLEYAVHAERRELAARVGLTWPKPKGMIGAVQVDRT
eukprot:6462458-Amphidinium_carterae.1